MVTQTAPDPPVASSLADLTSVMASINTCQAVLTIKIEQLQTDIGLHRHDMDGFRDRTAMAKQRVMDVEDATRVHYGTLHTLKIKIKALETRAEDAENRNLRNNLCIFGLPEEAECADNPRFTENLLYTLFPLAKFSTLFVVEWAYRMPVV